jgi:hypothetical protein
MATKHLQWALKLSQDNKNISESVLLKEHHCDNNPKVPYNLAQPGKHKVEGSDTIIPSKLYDFIGWRWELLNRFYVFISKKLFLVFLNPQAIMAST